MSAGVEKWIEMANRRPLKVCKSTGLGKGHIVGIPPRLRGYRDPLFYLLPGSVSIAVEVGTFQGWFAWRMAKYLPQTATIFCVDPFLDSDEYGDGSYNLRCWEKNLKQEYGKRVFLLRNDSCSAALEWNPGSKIDFLFIDGDHREDAVLDDLEHWVDHVRPGGLVSGHDIDGPHGPAVKAAVEKYCSENGVAEVHVSDCYSFTGVQVTKCWWFYKPENA